MNKGLKENILELYKEGVPYNEIVKILGCSKGTVSYHCRKNSLGSGYKKFSEGEKQLILDLYIDKRLSTKSISEKMGVSRYMIKTVTSNVQRDRITKSSSVVNWRKRTKLRLIAFLGSKCQLCGYDRYEGSLEFHHLDPSKKDFTIGGKSNSYERLLAEVKKCILVCSNCHKEIHGGIRKYISA